VRYGTLSEHDAILLPMPSAEELMRAYDQAGKAERKLARDLARLGTRRESDVFLELLHYFPGAHLVKHVSPALPPAGEQPESRS
jgi:hypothetical protein